jgi:hypothetical protein
MSGSINTMRRSRVDMAPFIIGNNYLGNIHGRYHNQFVLMTIFLISAAALCTGLLLFVHLYLIATNQSTIEFWINIIESRAAEYNDAPVVVDDGPNKPKADWSMVLTRVMTNISQCVTYKNTSTYRNPFDTMSILSNLARVFKFLPSKANPHPQGWLLLNALKFVYLPDAIAFPLEYWLAKHVTKWKADESVISADVEATAAVGGSAEKNELVSLADIDQQVRLQKEAGLGYALATAGIDYSLVDTHGEEFLSDMADSIDGAAMAMNERFEQQRQEFELRQRHAFPQV